MKISQLIELYECVSEEPENKDEKYYEKEIFNSVRDVYTSENNVIALQRLLVATLGALRKNSGKAASTSDPVISTVTAINTTTTPAILSTPSSSERSNRWKIYSVVDLYLGEKRYVWSKHTLTNCKSKLRRAFEEYEEYPIHFFDKKNATAVRKSIVNGYAPVTSKNMLRSVKAFWLWCQEKNFVSGKDIWK